MIVSTAELNEMEQFFSAASLPTIFKLNAAVTINDLPGYVNKILAGIKMQTFSDAVAKPRWNDLVEVRKMLGKT